MFQTILGIVVVAIIAILWGAMPRLTAKREAQRFAKAEQEIRRQEKEARLQAEKRRKEEEQKQIADESVAVGRALKEQGDAQIDGFMQQFKETHDQLVALIRQQAKQGCDAEFQQRFGVTRPPKAADPADDPEVQEYLREHYSQLRDAAIGEYLEQAIAEEATRQESAAPRSVPTADDDAENPEDAESLEQGATDTEADDEELASQPDSQDLVREYFDVDSIRTYLLAAISSRFNQQGLPVGEAPWPAYTSFSPLGYGELILADGAPVSAQDAYRAFAWKKFHLGRRSEKPTRGEYSWPASHELGDTDADAVLETPAGTFSVSTSEGPLPLREFESCQWAHKLLPHDDMLLGADERHFLLVNLEGLHKGRRLYVRFNSTQDFLEDAGDTDYAFCLAGHINQTEIGLAISNPGAASPGDAPYRIAESNGTGFVLEMTQDARRHDADTYPQFVQVDLAWRSAHAPLARETVVHAIN